MAMVHPYQWMEFLGGTDCDDTNADTFMGAAQIEGLALCMRETLMMMDMEILYPPLVSQQVQTVTMIKQISHLQTTISMVTQPVKTIAMIRNLRENQQMKMEMEIHFVKQMKLMMTVMMRIRLVFLAT